MRYFVLFLVPILGCLPDDTDQAAGSNSGLCFPAQLRCQDNQVEQCSADGSQFTLVEACSTEQYCDQAQCYDQVCRPNFRRCESGQVMVCDPRGSAEAEAVAGDCAADGLQCVGGRCMRQPCAPECGPGTYCDGMGNCLNQVCEPEARGCVENTLRTCDQWGSGYLEALDQDCGQRAQCLADRCVPITIGDAGPGRDGGASGSCAAHEECPLHQRCHPVGRRCEDLMPPDCRDDRQCPPGQFCEREIHQEVGQCQFGAPECQQDGDCAPGLVCQRGHCVAPGSGCEADAQCDEGQICEEGVCRAGCRGDAQCPAGERCANNRCVPAGQGCSSHRDCALDQACLNGDCIRPVSRQGQACQHEDDCGWGEGCLALALETSYCVGSCGTGDDCPSGNFCLAVAGARVCIPDHIGVVDEGQATLANGELCSAQGPAMCQSGLCLGQPGRCRPNCAHDDHCSGDRVCTHIEQAGQSGRYLQDLCADPGEFGPRPGSNGAGQSCATGDACVSGLCLDRVCRASCCTSLECPDRQICRQESFDLGGGDRWWVNVCVTVPPAFTLGQGAAGSVCGGSADCRSGICTDGLCVDACCNRQDCEGTAACQPSVTRRNGEQVEALMNLCVAGN